MVIQPPFKVQVNSNIYFWFHHLPRPISLTWSAEENSRVNCLMAAFWPRTQSITALAGAVCQHPCTWVMHLTQKAPKEPRVHAWHIVISEWWTHHMFFPTEAGHILRTNPFSCLPQIEALATTVYSWPPAVEERMLLLVPGPSCCFPSGAGWCVRLALLQTASQEYLFSLCLFWTEQTF